MLIDLHTHSTASDGTQPPAEVIERAAAAGLGVVSLTDHDSSSGWQEAAAAARQVGIGFVPGIEISTKHGGTGVHLLGYLFDPSYPPLQAELERILAGRAGRLTSMLTQLRATGVEITEADVIAQAGRSPAIGRPHVADVMVANGLAADRSAAFATYLDPGRPGYVVRYAPQTAETIRLVTEAGGVAVIAHPWGRGSRRVIDLAALASFASAGLVGLEVDHQDHTPDDRVELRRLAAEAGLLVTGASDYHGDGKVAHELGCNVTAPDQLERLLEAAGRAGRVSGRSGAAGVGL